MAVEHWIWLQTVLGYNSSCIHKIIDEFGSAEEFYAVASTGKNKLPLSSHAMKRLRDSSLDNAFQILKECEQSGIEVIPFSSDKYPKRSGYMDKTAFDFISIKVVILSTSLS